MHFSLSDLKSCVYCELFDQLFFVLSHRVHSQSTGKQKMTNKWNFEPGQILLVQLASGTYCGEFVSKVDNSRLSLTNVCRMDDKSSVLGRQIYYKDQILSVKCFSDPNASDVASSVVSSEERVVLDLEEYQAVERLIANHTYITQTDEHYHKAVKELSAQDYIAVGLEGNGGSGRRSNTSLLVAATSKNVYLFDILFLGRILPELRRVLDGRFPRKIVHDGRLVADNLKHVQDMELRPLFDTMVAHIATNASKEVISVEACVNQHFNLHLKEDTLGLLERPLTDHQKLVAAKHVAYLLKLHKHFVFKVMLP
jgi:3'-5' exonuclease